jgi:hypothetical protein
MDAAASARIIGTVDQELVAGRGAGTTLEQQRLSGEPELPEIRAWVLRSCPALASEIDSIISEWSGAPRTCRELHWLEGALTRQRRLSAGRRRG